MLEMLTSKLKYGLEEHGSSTSTSTIPDQPIATSGYKFGDKKHRHLGTSNSAGAQRQNQSHIKQLITTAAAGNGVVGDVDAMLTPMHNHRGHSISPKQQRDSRPERNLWSKTEMLEMLQIMDDNNAVDKLNDKSIKSDTVFRLVEEIMHDNGFRKKSHVQIWTKWKFLKSTYNTTKRSGTVPKMIPIEVYQKLCKMLDSSSGASGGAGGDSSVGPTVSDCDNSMLSMEGEGKSNGVIDKSSTVLSTGAQNETSYEQENDLDMAHPIFGFRLGLVKPEPADTGYETNVDNSETIGDQDPLAYSQNSNATGVSFEHTPFEVEVKQELLEGSANTPPPTAPASPTPVPPHIPLRARIHADHNGSKRLSRNSVGGYPQLITSTPQREQQTQEPQLPPLRVAPFAKELTNGCAMSGVLKIDRPPPPLSMKPARLNNTSDITFTQHASKLMLPKLPTQSQSQLQYNYVRLPKEISVQPARNSSLLRLKSVPMRKTPYSLRPERMIPDLEQSISPPPSPVPEATTLQREMHSQSFQRHQQPFSMYDTGLATTSRQAQISLLKDRKRRLPFDMQPVPIKLQHQSHISSYKQDPSYAELKDDLSDDNDDNDEDEEYDQEDEYEEKHNGTSNHRTEKANKRKLETIFEKELFKLADGLRQTQRDMLHDFFEQQKEFARREHEFQLKQDMIVIRAFRKQTDELMKTAKVMLGVDLKKKMVVDKSSSNDEPFATKLPTPTKNKTESKPSNDTSVFQSNIKMDRAVDRQMVAAFDYLSDYPQVARTTSVSEIEQAVVQNEIQAENIDEDNAKNVKDNVGLNIANYNIAPLKPESIQL